VDSGEIFTNCAQTAIYDDSQLHRKAGNTGTAFYNDARSAGNALYNADSAVHCQHQ